MRAEAEACFQRAIVLAREQGARSWELRATMSFSGLWHRQGKSAEARRALAESYRTFSEGLDTPDLRRAKELLRDLSASVRGGR